jgi:hypothetical protein
MQLFYAIAVCIWSDYDLFFSTRPFPHICLFSGVCPGGLRRGFTPRECPKFHSDSGRRRFANATPPAHTAALTVQYKLVDLENLPARISLLGFEPPTKWTLLQTLQHEVYHCTKCTFAPRCADYDTCTKYRYARSILFSNIYAFQCSFQQIKSFIWVWKIYQLTDNDVIIYTYYFTPPHLVFKFYHVKHSNTELIVSKLMAGVCYCCSSGALKPGDVTLWF